MQEQIREGFMVFVSDGDEGVGAVREIRNSPPGLVVYIENTGDFLVPLGVVEAVHSDKVILNCDRLDPALRSAINHARDAEDPFYVAPPEPPEEDG
ncbi:MAG TPA: hypothetical protein VLZ76_02910 [Lysobacter sp.]|jgi:hypothetical protein|nr:hypothetical protein [Lysobacter sp.]